jgi:hypothetical protein
VAGISPRGRGRRRPDRSDAPRYAKITCKALRYSGIRCEASKRALRADRIATRASGAGTVHLLTRKRSNECSGRSSSSGIRWLLNS